MPETDSIPTKLERHPGGRPRLYDRAAYLPILTQAFALGTPIRFAAASAGIPRATLESWLKADDEYSDQLRKAQADGLIAMMAQVRENPKGPGGAGWLLERRYREDFGAHTTVTHSIDEAQVKTLMEQYGVTETEVRDALSEAAKLLTPPKK